MLSTQELKAMFGSPSKALLLIRKDAQAQSGAANLQSMKKLLSGMDLSDQTLSQSELLQVQYNPASLKIQASAMPAEMQSIQQADGSGSAHLQSGPPSMVLSVQLLFDAVNNQDAFMADKFRLSMADVAAAGAGIADIYSVRPQMNGLIGMIMGKSSRNVLFQWRDFSFEGTVTEVSASYLMFNMKGNPIRGSVNLTIAQGITDGGYAGYWSDAFEKCFSSRASQGKNMLEKAGNLVNLNII